MRSKAEVRDEIRRLIDRGRLALGLSESQMVGCSKAEIEEILDAQGVERLPPPLEELMLVSGADDDKVLQGLFPGTEIGRWEMVTMAKEVAARTSDYNKSGEVFGSDRVVFRSHPDGSVLWLEVGETDPAVFVMTEEAHSLHVIYPRLACNLEQRVVLAEFKAAGRPERVRVFG